MTSSSRALMGVRAVQKPPSLAGMKLSPVSPHEALRLGTSSSSRTTPWQAAYTLIEASGGICGRRPKRSVADKKRQEKMMHMQDTLRFTDANGVCVAGHKYSSFASRLRGRSSGAVRVQDQSNGTEVGLVQCRRTGRSLEGSMWRRPRTQDHHASTELNGDHRGEDGFETRSWPAPACLVR